jgi:ribosomal protein S27E
MTFIWSILLVRCSFCINRPIIFMSPPFLVIKCQ